METSDQQTQTIMEFEELSLVTRTRSCVPLWGIMTFWRKSKPARGRQDGDSAVTPTTSIRNPEPVSMIATAITVTGPVLPQASSSASMMPVTTVASESHAGPETAQIPGPLLLSAITI